jgi:hypothetical protein
MVKLLKPRGIGHDTVEGLWVNTYVPSEREEQAALVAWLLKEYPQLVFFSVPNEGKRTDFMKFHMKSTGLLSGVPDLILLFDEPLFVEMKRTKGGTLSDNQKQVIAWIRASGYTVEVCRGFQEAKQKIQAFALQHSDRPVLRESPCPELNEPVKKAARKARSK